MTDPHSCCGNEDNAGTPAPKKKHSSPHKASRHRGQAEVGSDPHHMDDEVQSGSPSPGAASQSVSGATKAEEDILDPHAMPDDHTPPYAGSVKRQAAYPSGADICTTEEWSRVILSAARVDSVKAASENICVLSVKVGGRDKLVWAERESISNMDSLAGETILIIDNLEPRRVGDEILTGKALSSATELIRSSLPHGTRVQ